MKRNILFALCMLMSSICIAQLLPTLEKGSSFQFPLNKNGKKYLDFYLENVQYLDSTVESCQAIYTFKVTSYGTATIFGNTSSFSNKTATIISPYFKVSNGMYLGEPLQISSLNSNMIHRDSSINIQFKLECISQRGGYFFVNSNKVAYVKLFYDARIIKNQMANKKREIWAQNLYDSLAQELTLDIENLDSYGQERMFIYSEFPEPGNNWQGEGYYLINGKTIEVHFHNDRNKYDTTFFFNKISPFLMEQYEEESSELRQERIQQEQANKRLAELRNKKVSEIDAREVFDYFPRGIDIVEFTKQMGNKQLAVTPCCYETTFYDKFEKKDILFQFTFSDSGKLTSIKRESTNTMPTNDVWSAFMLQETVETFRDLGKALEILKKDKKNTSTKK